MESGSDCKQGYHSSWFKVGHLGLFAGTWNHKSVLQPILRDGHGACHRARIRATRWRPPQDEVQLAETQQPHAEERATRASRSMGSKRLTDVSSSVLGARRGDIVLSLGPSSKRINRIERLMPCRRYSAARKCLIRP